VENIMKEKKVAVFLADGFEEVEAITPVDLLQRAGIIVDTVSITDDNLVESARKVKILTDKVIGEKLQKNMDCILLKIVRKVMEAAGISTILVHKELLDVFRFIQQSLLEH